MKLSVMSYTLARTGWFKDNKNNALKNICELAQKLEIDGIDWVTTYDIDPKDIRQVMDDNGLKTVCHTFSAAGLMLNSFIERCTAVDNVKVGMEDALILGADKVMIVTPGIANIPRDLSRRNYIRGLQECAVCARQTGLMMTIENFPGADSPFVISSDVLEAFREIPGLKLTYDNGNIAMGGEDPAVSFERCAEYIVHAHFKDWNSMPAGKGRVGLDGRYYEPALIGEGIIDHKTCLDTMRRAGYTDYINIEYEGNKYPADEATGKAARYLQNLMRDQ